MFLLFPDLLQITSSKAKTVASVMSERLAGHQTIARVINVSVTSALQETVTTAKVKASANKTTLLRKHFRNHCFRNNFFLVCRSLKK